jgi:hypothetical protein
MAKERGVVEVALTTSPFDFGLFSRRLKNRCTPFMFMLAVVTHGPVLSRHLRSEQNQVQAS